MKTVTKHGVEAQAYEIKPGFYQVMLGGSSLGNAVDWDAKKFLGLSTKRCDGSKPSKADQKAIVKAFGFPSGSTILADCLRMSQNESEFLTLGGKKLVAQYRTEKRWI